LTSLFSDHTRTRAH